MKSRKSTAILRLLKRCDLPLAYTPEQVAERLKLPRQRVYWLMETWRIRSVTYRGRRYVTRAEMERIRHRAL